MKSIRRLTLILLIVAVCTLSAFARGSKEESASEPIQVSSFVRSISTLFDYATTEICIAVHPFPSVLQAFTEYDTEQSDWDSGESSSGVLVNKPLSRVKESDFLLSSETRQTFDLSEMSNIFSTKGGTILQRDLTAEKKSWGIISYLFVIFTVLEVLYVTIRGYLVDEENLIRKLVTRLLMAGILFLVLMTLPALVELFRIGFFQLAETITTPFAFTEVTEARSVFELPGGVLRCTSKLLQNMSPESMGWSLDAKVSGWGSLGNWFLMMVIRVLYFCLTIAVMVLSLFSAFSIMANVVEVYILLAIVMCLVPFQVFSGTKFLVGENLIKSLFANIVELFVIMVIIGTTANAAYTISEIGTRYITNPSYYPVSITIDTKKLTFGDYVFAEGLDNKQGLALEFYTAITDSEFASAGESRESQARAIMEARFLERYLDKDKTMSPKNLDLYRNPGSTFDQSVYLSGTVYSGIYPLVNSNNVYYRVGKETSTENCYGTPAFAMGALLKYLMSANYLRLEDADSTSMANLSPEEQEGLQMARAIRQKMKDFLSEISEKSMSTDTAGFWEGSVSLDVDFDVAGMRRVEGYSSESELWFAEIPIRTAKLTFLGMLGSEVENFAGNKDIDAALLEFLNECMAIMGSRQKWGDLSYVEKAEVLSRINNSIGNAITVNHDQGLIDAADLPAQGTASLTWNLVIQHFFVSIMAALMQVYFIKKSSSITQALMSGSVSQDRLAALERGIGRMATTGGMAPLRMGVGLLGGLAGGLSNNASGPTPGAATGAAGAAGRAAGGAPINDIRP